MDPNHGRIDATTSPGRPSSKNGPTRPREVDEHHWRLSGLGQMERQATLSGCPAFVGMSCLSYGWSRPAPAVFKIPCGRRSGVRSSVGARLVRQVKTLRCVSSTATESMSRRSNRAPSTRSRIPPGSSGVRTTRIVASCGRRDRTHAGSRGRVDKFQCRPVQVFPVRMRGPLRFLPR